jgi:hypothetical protein
MFTAKQYREKAAEYLKLAAESIDPGEMKKLKELERGFTYLAKNAEWLNDNSDIGTDAPREAQVESAALADQEEHILRCLGAAVIRQWNTIPTKLQRELFDSAGSMDELLQTSELKGQIARFLHNRR